VINELDRIIGIYRKTISAFLLEFRETIFASIIKDGEEII